MTETGASNRLVSALLGPYAEVKITSRPPSSIHIPDPPQVCIHKIFGIPLPHCPLAGFIKLAIKHDYSMFA